MPHTPLGWIDMGEDPDDHDEPFCPAAHPDTNTMCDRRWHPDTEHHYEHDEEGVEPYLVTWIDDDHLRGLT